MADPETNDIKAAAKALARLGGLARAKKLSREQRSAIGRHAMEVRWKDHVKKPLDKLGAGPLSDPAPEPNQLDAVLTPEKEEVLPEQKDPPPSNWSFR
jgi:hypothetical protein